MRPVTGLITVVVIGLICVLAAAMFRDDFADTVEVTVMSPRAGLVMNPDAKVQIHGVQVGKVSSIEPVSDESAAIHLAIDRSRLDIIPANSVVDIASTTVFGAKFVRFVSPPQPSGDPIREGQVFDSEHVMIEINTVFEELVSVLSSVQPEKLNETLGAISAAMSNRGKQFGDTLSDLNSILGQINPHLDAMNRGLAAAPDVFGAYADAAPSLISITDSATRLGNTIVEKRTNLDALLVSAIGLADVGNEVLTENGQPLTDVLRLLVPTTDLLNQYRQALYCALGGIQVMANMPPLNVPGVEVLAGFLWGQDRYRYPSNLPKVAASGGPQCTDLPKVPYGKAPPFVVSDVGANPWQYGNPGIVLNAAGLKELLFGPTDGPPRNSAQIGQPG